MSGPNSYLISALGNNSPFFVTETSNLTVSPGLYTQSARCGATLTLTNLTDGCAAAIEQRASKPANKPMNDLLVCMMMIEKMMIEKICQK